MQTMRRVLVEMALLAAGVALGVALVFVTTIRPINHETAWITWGYPFVWRSVASASPLFLDQLALYEDIAFWLVVSLAFVEFPVRIAALYYAGPVVKSGDLGRLSAPQSSGQQQQHQPSRTAFVVAAAIIIAAVLVSASVFVASAWGMTTTETLTTTATVTTVSTVTVVSVSVTTISPSSSSNGLEFTMNLSPTTVYSEGAVDVQMNLYNALSVANDVSPADNWALTNQSEVSNSSSFGPGACIGSMGPYRVAVFKRFYGLNNYSGGVPLSIFPWPAQSPFNYCNFYVIEHSWLGSTSYPFDPQSNNAKLSLPDQGSWTTPMSLTVVLKPLGVSLPAGQYTVVCGDEWGDLQIAHFMVEPT
jgi:hypothetical protein